MITRRTALSASSPALSGLLCGLAWGAFYWCARGEAAIERLINRDISGRN